MGKIWVEICLISARGLTRTSSLWKLQWFAVGWIDPNNKYCTKIDASGNANPTWKTKFSALIDSSDSKFDDLALNVEVYSRDPVFLKERLQGTASVELKEFLDKHKNNSKTLRHVEEVGSFQLRKRNSNKPQGFVDVSFQISQETNEDSMYEGDDVGIKLRIRDHGMNLPSQIGHSENHLQTNYPNPLPPGSSYYQNRAPMPSNYSLTGGSNYQPPPVVGPSYPNPLPPGPSYYKSRAPMPSNYPLTGGSNYQPPPVVGPSYHQPLAQQPPQPYSVGYIPTSSTENLPPSYINMPGARSGQRPGPGFAMGLGAGALAAGAAIFGDDFVSGFDLPTDFTISRDPPF